MLYHSGSKQYYNMVGIYACVDGSKLILFWNSVTSLIYSSENRSYKELHRLKNPETLKTHRSLTGVTRWEVARRSERGKTSHRPEAGQRVADRSLLTQWQTQSHCKGPGLGPGEAGRARVTLPGRLTIQHCSEGNFSDSGCWAIQPCPEGYLIEWPLGYAAAPRR